LSKKDNPRKLDLFAQRLLLALYGERAIPCSARELREQYAHEFIDHAEKYFEGAVHTNGLENFWALFKRCIKGTHVNVEPFHLAAYVDSEAYRLNNRKADDGARFAGVLGMVSGKRLDYRTLIGKNDMGGFHEAPPAARQKKDLMQKQTLTLKIEGKGEILDAESVATAIESLIALLKSVDKNSWPVGTERYKWNVTSASMQSPFTITLEAISRNQEILEYDVVGATCKGLMLLDTETAGKNPVQFDDASLMAAKKLVGIYHDSIVDISIKASGISKEIHPSTKITKSIERITSRIKTIDRDGFGSIDGALRQITVDEREEHRQTGLEIIDRATDEIVKCKVTADQAVKLGPYIRKRVILYGLIRYRNDVPIQITLENFDAIDEPSLPTLEDIHRSGIEFCGGKDSADIIDELRGNGD
jgi:hypothetical protein